jgi:signal transduction histidine kinase
VFRPTIALFVLISATLAAFGFLADRALEGQERRAREAAVTHAVETARLSAQSVRAALAQLEQRVLARDVPAGVVSERAHVPPPPSVPRPGMVAYGQRPRAELARLLGSTEASPSGVPEAVLARLALGESPGLSAPGQVVPDVAERLLAGELPVRPEDLPWLARRLGVTDGRRVTTLVERLQQAPDPTHLPRAPAFRRTLQQTRLEGWTLDGRQRVRYETTAAALIQLARLPDDATVAAEGGPATDPSVAVPDVEGLRLRVPVRAPETRRWRLLRVALWLAVGASITFLVAIQRALAAESRATAREKTFLANVTHELRTPLAAIRLFGERLAEGRGEPRDYGALIAQESQRLESLVERVLALTRAGERPSFAPVDPVAILRSAVELIAPRAERREVRLTCRTAEGVPIATWDADAVRRAMLNLLDNAIQHGREGGAVEAGAAHDGDTVCLSVRDDGPGIGPRERRTVFGRFARGKTDAPGTGLGLHFVEQVAHAHGGRVDLTSEEGRGCVFTLRLPLHPPAAELPR